MNGSYLRLAKHLRTPAYSTQKLCGYLLPHYMKTTLYYLEVDPIGHKVTNHKQEKICSPFLAQLRIKPRTIQS